MDLMRRFRHGNYERDLSTFSPSTEILGLAVHYGSVLQHLLNTSKTTGLIYFKTNGLILKNFNKYQLSLMEKQLLGHQGLFIHRAILLSFNIKNRSYDQKKWTQRHQKIQSQILRAQEINFRRGKINKGKLGMQTTCF